MELTHQEKFVPLAKDKDKSGALPKDPSNLRGEAFYYNSQGSQVSFFVLIFNR
jgi:hypothetical protein